MAEFREAVAAAPGSRAESWRPTVAAVPPGQAELFGNVCRLGRVAVVDTIGRQLEDLATVRFPADGQEWDRKRFAADAVSAAGGWASVGVWVYLPWAHKVAHVLAEDDFFDVITDRNRDKITRAEQRALRNRSIGVVGLSVGGEAAVSIAQEHLCGTIKVADFDQLELSNLNRLNAGIDDLGVPKAWIVARRIALIDPFIQVSVFDQGVSPATIDSFLNGVDLIVEECDDLATKHEIRLLAKARGIDVVYAADERGFLSVEPYRAYPDLPVFHGLVAAPALRRDAANSRAAFLRALTQWLGGFDSISTRSQYSVEMVGVSLSGYPQLASEARFAAGQVGHVARRLLLGEQIAPFHGHLDLHDLLR
jgi:tRNA threonylcarbamoyladenosine dehydratase